MKFSKKALLILAMFTFAVVVVLGLATGTLAPKDSTPTILVKREIARSIAHLLSLYDPWEDNKKAAVCPAQNIDFSAYTAATDEILRLLTGHNIKVLEYNNPIFKKTSFDFEYQQYDDDKLRQLNKEYKLYRFFAKADNDFEGLLRLREWVKSRWEHGQSLNTQVQFNNFDALKILDLAKGGERFVCGEYSYTYVQCVSAVGGCARVVLIRRKDKRKFHVVSEVWSNKWEKWVMMDVDQDIHYEKAGIPQSALELHNALVRKQTQQLERVKGRHCSLFWHTVNSPTKGVELYYNIAIRMRNNFFEEYPKWHSRGNLFIDSLEWVDEFTKDRYDIVSSTNRISEFNWDLNETTIYFKKDNDLKDPFKLDILLDTFTPNFRAYLISINGGAYKQKPPIFKWEIKDGLNSLKVSTVNEFGVKGRTSEIIVER